MINLSLKTHNNTVTKDPVKEMGGNLKNCVTDRIK